MQSNIKIKRASFAFNQMATINREEDNNPKQLVALIYQNGLLSALNKMKDKNEQVFNACMNWMNEYNNIQKFIMEGNTPFIFTSTSTIPKVLAMDNKLYRIWTIEIVDYLNWICRYY